MWGKKEIENNSTIFVEEKIEILLRNVELFQRNEIHDKRNVTDKDYTIGSLGIQIRTFEIGSGNIFLISLVLIYMID